MLSVAVKRALFLPGQVIIKKDSVSHDMFYVHSGAVEVSSDAIYNIMKVEIFMWQHFAIKVWTVITI